MNRQDFELLLLKIRTWTGLGLIALLTLQIVTGYALAGRIEVGLIDLKLTRFIHTQFSWILIYFFLTHATVNLRYLFRRWWPKQAKPLVRVLVAVYVAATLATLYIQFFR